MPRSGKKSTATKEAAIASGTKACPDDSIASKSPQKDCRQPVGLSMWRIVNYKSYTPVQNSGKCEELQEGEVEQDITKRNTHTLFINHTPYCSEITQINTKSQNKKSTTKRKSSTPRDG